MSVLDRVTRWLAPPPPPPADMWEPPMLSAAASAPPRPGPNNGATKDTKPTSTTTAANSPVPLSLRPPRPREWQVRAWEAYRQHGAARQAVNWLAHGLSRCHLYVGQVVADGAGDPEPIENPGVAGEILSELHDGPIGQSAMLKRLAIGLLVAGETWLAGYPKPPEPSESSSWPGGTAPPPGAGEATDQQTAWAVVSRREWQDSGESAIRLKLARHPELGPDGWVSFPADQVVLVPIYDPDPEDALYPTSAFEAALKDTDELEGLSQRVGADIRSRLAGAGVLAIAESATLPNPSASSGVNPLHGDPFLQALLAAARTGIQNPGDPSATVPITIKVPDEAVSGGIRHITFSTPFDAQIPVLRQDARRTLAADLDIPANVVTGIDDLSHWCTLPSVEILTKEGWKTYAQLAVGEPVLTLNHETGLSEWQPLLAVNTWQVTDEPMIKLTGKRHSSVTTVNHRWPITKMTRNHNCDAWYPHREWTTSGDLFLKCATAGPNRQNYNYLPLAAPHADLPVQPKYEDALVELVAWFFTEGHYEIRPGRRTPKVTIYQSHKVNPDNVARICRALTSLFGPESESLDKGGRYATLESVARRAKARELRGRGLKVKDVAAALGVSEAQTYKYLREDARVGDAVPRWRTYVKLNADMTVFILNSAAAQIVTEHAPDRVVSTEFVQHLTAAQLELFIDAAIRGDGHYLGRAKTPVITQKDPAMLDAMELAAILAGYSTYRYDVTNTGRSATGPREKTQHTLVLSRRTGFAPRGRNFDETTYTGTIWCPTTPNGTWLARNEGTVFFTGNSAWSVQDEAVRAHLGPLATLICTTITLDILWPAMRAAGEQDVEQKCIWWDASEITLRPDRSQTTLLAHQQEIISGKAARRELSFSEEDAPDADELAAAAAAKAAGQPGAAGGQADQQAGQQATGDGTTQNGQTPAQQSGQPGTQNGQPAGGQSTPAATPHPPASPGGARPVKSPPLTAV